MPPRRLRALLTFLVALPQLASGAVEGPGISQRIEARRTGGPIRVDGALDEAAWASAPVFDAFVERFPVAGAPPGERTEVRVLYDERNLYVAVVCRDSRPEGIVRTLGRRDSAPFSDAVQVIIDSTHDHRTAYLFHLSAGGVLGDGLFFEDRIFTGGWDEVWEGAAGSLEDGWVAELAIPLRVLQLSDTEEQVWGFGVRRDLARTHAELDSVHNPRTSGATVSRLGHLVGLEGLRPHRSASLVPYLAGRALLRPPSADPLRQGPGALSQSADVGLDLRAPLWGSLSLNGTLNPDFGQVEADQLILDVSNFESFFPEKRPFFNQGMELFQPVGGQAGSVPHALFYSRRIGLAAPILAAAKVSGSPARGFELGVLDAWVMGPGLGPGDEGPPDGSYRFHPERPLHLGPTDALPVLAPVTTNFFAAVARAQLGPSSTLGATLAAATPLSTGCIEEDLALPPLEQPAGCRGRGGQSAAVDFNLRSVDGSYGVWGQLSASQQVGGPPERRLADGTLLRRGQVGHGAYLRAGRIGGEGLRWELAYDQASPDLDHNATGFQPNQNEHAPRATVGFAQNGLGPLRSFFAGLGAGGQWSADGRGLLRSQWLKVYANATLPSSDYVGFEVGAEGPRYDLREVRGAGVAFEKRTSSWFALHGGLHPGRPVSLNAFAALGYHLAAGPLPSQWGWTVDATLAARPHPALETTLRIISDHSPLGARYVSALDADTFLFGELASGFLSTTLRQQWILSPRLSLQAYAQLFTALGVHGRFFQAAADANGIIALQALGPAPAPSQTGFYSTALNLNLVVRWEYAVGSNLFLVYSRGQQGAPLSGGADTVLPRGLFAGTSTDALMIKWSYHWAA